MYLALNIITALGIAACAFGLGFIIGRHRGRKQGRQQLLDEFSIFQKNQQQ